ncbi:MAG: hypothetical protein ABL928_12060, partial [Sphingorhabdus sp.]
MAVSVRPNIRSRLMLFFSVLLMVAAPAAAQISTIDPNDAIDADLGQPPKVDAPDTADVPTDAPIVGTEQLPADPNGAEVPTADQATYQDDDLLGAA